MSILNVSQINSVTGINTVTFQSDVKFTGNTTFQTAVAGSGVKIGQIKNTSGINTSTSNEIYNGRIAAWANFDGGSGTGNNDVTIRDSYNVSSVNDIAVGQFTVNFTSALPTANYAATSSAGNNPCSVSVRAFATTSVRLDVHDSSGADVDRTTVCVIITNP